MAKIFCGVCGAKAYSGLCFRHKPQKRIARSPIKQKPRKPIPQVSQKYGSSMAGMKRRWFKEPENQPTFEGYWYCWLRIAPDCQGALTLDTLRLEHVYPKTHYQHLRFNHYNILPGCDPCNKLKGSIKPDRLIQMYPHLQSKIEEVTKKVLTK